MELNFTLPPEKEEKLKQSLPTFPFPPVLDSLRESAENASTRYELPPDYIEALNRDHDRLAQLPGEEQELYPYVYARCKASGVEADVIEITTGRDRMHAYILEEAREAKEGHIWPFYPLNPDTRTIVNDKFIYSLQNDNHINQGPFDICVSNAIKGKNRHGEITAFFDAKSDLDITSIAEFDHAVHDAVITLYGYAKEADRPCTFNEATVYKMLMGGGEKPGPELTKAITQSLERLRRIYVDADYTDEAHARGFSTAYGYTCDGLVLELRRIKARYPNGAIAGEAWYLDTSKTPPLLQHSLMSRQIMTVPGSQYNLISKTGKTIRMTKPRMEVATYMFRRIKAMILEYENARGRQRASKIKGKKVEDYMHLSRNIRIDAILKNSHLDAESPKLKANYMSFIWDVLDNWINQGLISGYTRNKKGKVIISVEIILTKNKSGLNQE